MSNLASHRLDDVKGFGMCPKDSLIHAWAIDQYPTKVTAQLKENRSVLARRLINSENFFRNIKDAIEKDAEFGSIFQAFAHEWQEHRIAGYHLLRTNQKEELLKTGIHPLSQTAYLDMMREVLDDLGISTSERDKALNSLRQGYHCEHQGNTESPSVSFVLDPGAHTDLYDLGSIIGGRTAQWTPGLSPAVRSALQNAGEAILCTIDFSISELSELEAKRLIFHLFKAAFENEVLGSKSVARLTFFSSVESVKMIIDNRIIKDKSDWKAVMKSFI